MTRRKLPVIRQEAVWQDEPSPLITFQVVCPFEKPAFHLLPAVLALRVAHPSSDSAYQRSRFSRLSPNDHDVCSALTMSACTTSPVTRVLRSHHFDYSSWKGGGISSLPSRPASLIPSPRSCLYTPCVYAPVYIYMRIYIYKVHTMM